MSFYRMHRGWMDNPALGGGRERFCRRAAWVWLIEEAAWEDRKRDICGKTVALKRGQVGHSLRFMAEAWGWNLAGVQRFIERLKTDTLIDTATDTGQTVITICNYDKYQAMPGYRDTPSDTPSDTGVIQGRYRGDTNLKEVNKVNKVIEEGSPADSPTPAPEMADVGVETGCFTPDGIAPSPGSGSLLPTADILTMPKREAETALEGWQTLARELGLPTVQKLTDARRRALVARLKDAGGIEGWNAALAMVRGSRLLRGEMPPRPGHRTAWCCTFDFLVSASGFVKVMEGNFRDDRPGAGSGDGFADLGAKMRAEGLL